jgi:hypothetical protein
MHEYTFSLWLEENTPSAEAMPIFMSLISPKQVETAKGYIHDINKALIDKAIPNPVFQEMKRFFANRLETVYEKYISEKYLYGGRYENLPKDVYEFTLNVSPHPELHRIQSWLKKVTALGKDKHPFTSDLFNFLTEISPLASAFEKLKGYIVKRQPRKEGEPGTKTYIPPITQAGAAKKISDLLTQITQLVYEDHVRGIMKWFERIVSNFMKAQAEGKKNGIHDYFKNNLYAKQIIYLVQEKKKYDYRPNAPIVLSANYTEILLQEAQRIAKNTQTQFVIKNTQKLASIITAKNNLKEAKMLHAEAGARGIQGSSYITFEDGSSFTVQNSAVWSTSIHGKPFLRFPTTFHNVLMSDGNRMSQPSEEKMNTIFVGNSAEKTT